MAGRHLAIGHGLGADRLGQRAARAQTAAGRDSIGLGISPDSMNGSRGASGSGTGTAAISARV